VLVSLVSFGVSGIYLSFLLTMIGSMIARARGWVPAGRFKLGRWAWPVSVIAAVYLGLMLVNVVAPTGPSSARAYFNLDWVTLLVMAVVTVIGVVVFLAAHRGREIGEHMIDNDALAALAQHARGPGRDEPDPGDDQPDPEAGEPAGPRGATA
jgi:amino acid transporter